MKGLQSALNPAGVGGSAIAVLWWSMLIMATLVLIAVMAALAWSLLRHVRGKAAADPIAFADRTDVMADRKATRVISVAVMTTVGILLVTFALSLGTSRAAARLAIDGSAEIEVIGVQWWWEVRYLDSLPSRIVRTANELHLPAGRSVRLRLESRDVIHSFWAPNLHGKMDLIPGRDNYLWVQATDAGTYRAQCAEFCGLQHAKMAMAVVVHEPEEYDAWLAAQREPARVPTDSVALAGLRTFEALPCAACHSIRGTQAYGRVGPDLTHFARRLTIAAGERPNTPAELSAWLASPQRIKPGNHMPDVPLDARQLEALVAYLSGLR